MHNLAGSDQFADRGVRVVSIANPASVQPVGGHTTPVRPNDVELEDSPLFAGDGTVPGKLSNGER